MTTNQNEFKVNFVADANLVSVLGEQLIGSERVGLLELIKNSYDAGATECDVWIEKVPGLPDHELSDPEIKNLSGPVITIADNGTGMNREIIEYGWLRPATTIKTNIKTQLKEERKKAEQRGTLAEYEQLVTSLKRAHKGRIPLGEKGVGRFATHRLGTYTRLITKTADENIQWLLDIDWNKFVTDHLDRQKDLQEVKLNLVSQPPCKFFSDKESGTLLRIYGGREGYQWDTEKLREIAMAIAHLQSPSAKKSGFQVNFHAPQLDEIIEIPTETTQAPFNLVAIIDENGNADIEVKFSPPNSLKYPLPPETWSFSENLRISPEDNQDYWHDTKNPNRLRKPECGPFFVEIDLWLRKSEWIDYASSKEFTEYLDAFGGISIYRDGLSIIPASITSKDDWLRLSTRHIKRGMNISYYMMVGNVDLIQEKTLGLIDRTSREGLLETSPFKDLSELVRRIVFSFEIHVQEIRERYTKLSQGNKLPEATLNKRTRISSAVIRQVVQKYDFINDNLELKESIGNSENPAETLNELADTLDDLRNELKEQRGQIDALLQAAGYGIAIGVAIHEIENVTSNLYYSINKLINNLGILNAEDLHTVQDLKDMSSALLNELKRVSPLRVTRLEKPIEFSILNAVLAASSAFRLNWEKTNISFIRTPKENDFRITGSFGAVSQVFANLFNNSTYWLRTTEQTPKRIYVQIDKENRKVVVADTGPGIDERIEQHLFKPFYSLKNPPSGLGLYISKYYMNQMKGTIRLAKDNELITGFSGAHFTIIFPKGDQ